MKFNWGLFVFTVLIIIAGLSIVYWKLFDDPYKRFHRFAMTDMERMIDHTRANESYYLAVYQLKRLGDSVSTKLLDDFIIEPAFLDLGKEYYIGRLYGNAKSRTLKGQVQYRLKNKDMLFGVSLPVHSSVGHHHLTLFREDSDSVCVYSDHRNGLFFVGLGCQPEQINRKSIDQDIAGLNLNDLTQIPDGKCIKLSSYDSFILKAGDVLFKFFQINSDTDERVRAQTITAYLAAHQNSNRNHRSSRKSLDETVPASNASAQEDPTRPVIKERDEFVLDQRTIRH